jgi:hypothetical protein
MSTVCSAASSPSCAAIDGVLRRVADVDAPGQRNPTHGRQRARGDRVAGAPSEDKLHGRVVARRSVVEMAPPSSRYGRQRTERGAACPRRQRACTGSPRTPRETSARRAEEPYDHRVLARRSVVEMAPPFIAIRPSTDRARGCLPASPARVYWLSSNPAREPAARGGSTALRMRRAWGRAWARGARLKRGLKKGRRSVFPLSSCHVSVFGVHVRFVRTAEVYPAKIAAK